MDENQARDDITGLFVSWRHGAGSADFDALFAALYRELRVLAHRQAGSRGGETLRTTALVHEAYLRLVDNDRIGIRDRTHFLALAARVMRNVLVDRAREKGRQKRGGDLQRVELEDDLAGDTPGVADVLAMDDALARLAALDARQAEVAQMRVFGGLSVEEAAAVLQVSTATVKRDWHKARMFLIHALGPDSGA